MAAVHLTRRHMASCRFPVRTPETKIHHFSSHPTDDGAPCITSRLRQQRAHRNDSTRAPAGTNEDGTTAATAGGMSHQAHGDASMRRPTATSAYATARYTAQRRARRVSHNRRNQRHRTNHGRQLHLNRRRRPDGIHDSDEHSRRNATIEHFAMTK